ncbi:glycerol-3-phosphate acyltransferase [Sclerotinia borealis F-4128]|uniref:Glycerol-3-phosphate acyltransferase n=1 Tax=Sclerotinia borealis (strain F-4128) TaxID=1432307 RepID=W9CL73_SCLBF|nr:glycerol-3-phosphate acyltransferase [Sclerotinia borealis F-4128]
MTDNRSSSPPRTSAPDLEILGDQVTLHPSGYIEPPERPHDGEKERNLVEHMARFRSSPLEFLREVSLHVSGTGWRAYDHFIGQPIFYPGFSENMTAAVMSTPILQKRISELAEKRIGIEEQEGLLDKDDPLYHSKKITEEVCHCKKFTRAFRKADGFTDSRGWGQSEFPCRRELFTTRWLVDIPRLWRKYNNSIGAMWIRRSFGDDALYTTLVQSYIDTLLQGGFNFECFIEGGRSRTGKLLPPKFGILSFILDSILSGRVKDTIICPVSTQYDKVIETEGYVGELLGLPKKKENLADFLSASSVLSLKLGRVDVRFHEPWSLRDFILQQQARSLGIPNTLDFESINIPSVRQKLLRTLGFKVLSDINAVSVVMPTALVGTVLLTLRGRGVGKSELIRRVEWISERVGNKGGRVAHFAGATTSAVVERALEVLGKDLVGRVDGLAEETYYAVDRFQLSFYRNMTIHLFISEALVSASMYMNVKRGGGKVHQNIPYEELRNQVQFLSQLFRGEFIYPTEGLAVNLDNTLHDLESDNIVELIRDSEGKIVTIGLSDHERSVGRENYDFYCFLIWPFIEAFWLGAVSLMGFTPPLNKPNDVWLEVKKAHDGAQLLGKTLYHQGDLSYFEAVNKETLKNSYQRFEDEGIVIVSKSKNTKIQPRSRLAPEWTPTRNPENGMIIAEGKLWDFIEKIAKSRREGKNRRDGATVSTRVLRLADELGQTLFAEGSGDIGMSEEDKKELQRREKRRQALKARAHL